MEKVVTVKKVMAVERVVTAKKLITVNNVGQ